MQLENWLALTLTLAPRGNLPFGHAGTNHRMIRLSAALESFSLSPGERDDGVRAVLGTIVSQGVSHNHLVSPLCRSLCRSLCRTVRSLAIFDKVVRQSA